MSACPAYGTVTKTTSAPSTAWGFSAPATSPPPAARPARSAASTARSASREPITTSTPASARRTASAKPRSPVPPTIATVMARRIPGPTVSDRGPVLPERPPESVRDLAQGGPGLQSVAHRVEEVVRAPGGLLDLLERAIDCPLVAIPSEGPDLFHLLAHRVLVVTEELDGLFLILGVAVHSDDHPLPGLDALMDPERRLVDLVLDPSGLDRGDRPPHALDLLQ